MRIAVRLVHFVFVLAAIGGCAADVPRVEVKIIVNRGVAVSEISKAEVNRIFLFDKTSLQGAAHLEPVLDKTESLLSAFLKEYIGRTDAALMTYYRSMVFTGRGSIPKTFGSDNEVIEYVGKTKGAIGYVSENAQTPGVKTLTVK